MYISAFILDLIFWAKRFLASVEMTVLTLEIALLTLEEALLLLERIEICGKNICFSENSSKVKIPQSASSAKLSLIY